MNIYLSYRERMAGLFLLLAALGVIAFTVGAAIQNRWFEPRITYHTIITRGDGIREGSPVLLAGVEIGEIGELAFQKDNSLDVEILIRERYNDRVRRGTRAQIRRLFGFGEKRIYLILDETTGEYLKPGSFLEADEVMDLMDIASNMDIEQYLKTMDKAVSILEQTLSKLDENNRVDRMMDAFDQLGPTLVSVNHMINGMDEPFVELIKDPSVRKTFKGAARLFNDPNTRKAMRAMAESFDAKQMHRVMNRMESSFARFEHLMADDGDFVQTFAGANRVMNDPRTKKMMANIERMTDVDKLEKLVDNLSIIAEEMAKMSPQIPKMTTSMIKAMNEASVVLRALQKTNVLDDKSDDAKKELKKEER